MKGIIFNVAEATVSQEFGENTWDDLLDDAGLEGSYTALGDYPVEQLMAIVTAASEKLSLPPEDVVRFIGRRGFAILIAKYPDMAVGHQSARSFVLALNEVIHPEVRKLYPGSDVPTFEYRASDEAVLEIEYVSNRQLCYFAEGLIMGCADHFDEIIELSQPVCQHHGARSCVLRLQWIPNV